VDDFPLDPVPWPAPAADAPSPAPRALPDWAPWTAPAALLTAFGLAVVGAVLLTLPAAALGVKVSSSHIPAGLTIADTFLEEAAFVLTAVLFARSGGRVLRPWQFGLRDPRGGWRRALGWIALLIGFVIVFIAVWSSAFNIEKEKVLEQLGANEGTALLLLSALLTCVMAPICEEILFRGYIFAALRNWRGPWTAALLTGLAFGGVHASSAPALDLVPLAALGFALCLLYQRTGSLYPGIATHSLNNSVAFAGLEGWGWQLPVLVVAALAAIWLLRRTLTVAGVLPGEAPPVGMST
jgi:CAAX protease family protein